METVDKHKYDFLLYLLEKGDVMVCLDARRGDVDVPKTHKQNPALSLVLNLSFRHPVEVHEDGIYATLLFQGRPSKCVLSFGAVWAIFNPTFQEGQVWEESLPKDVDLTQHMQMKQLPQPIKKPTPLPGGEKSLASEKTSRPKKRDRSHLRVIK